MRWIEAAIETENEEIEDLCAALAELGVQGVSIEDEQDFKEFLENNRQYWDFVDEELEARFRGLSRVKFYLTDDETGRESLERIIAALGREIAVSTVDDEDWNSAWKQYYQPIKIGERLLVVPDWIETEANGRAVLRLEPGLAFGTGAHATTRLCLKALDGLDLAGKRVLDLGCGSGILGLAALVLGARSVRGCDVDPNARTAVEHNAALNGISAAQFQVRAGDILADQSLRKALGGGYDLVLSNIVADVIIALASFVAEFMATDGLWICSGIIDGRAAEVEAALTRGGFQIVRHSREEEWHCYVVRK